MSQDEPYEQILKREFMAEDGTFMLRLRHEMMWDRQAFDTLVQAMYQCCRKYEQTEILPRWIAGGFWFVYTFTLDWTSDIHNHWKSIKESDPEYFRDAYQYLRDLTTYLFEGMYLPPDFLKQFRVPYEKDVP